MEDQDTEQTKHGLTHEDDNDGDYRLCINIPLQLNNYEYGQNLCGYIWQY
jgi:hypothetical protein